MALSSTTSRVSYSGNGSTTAFSFPYYFLADADLVVILKASNGTETTQTITTHYTVSGAGNTAGGTVTMLTAPASGTTLTIYRDPAVTQDLDLVENDPMPAEEIEERLDKLTMISQRAKDRLDRAVRLTDGFSASFDPKLPAVLTADTVIKINAAGTAFEIGPTVDEIDTAAASASAAAASASAASGSASAAAASATAASGSATAAAASAAEAAVNAAAANVPTASDEYANGSITASVAANALTIALKTSSGSDASAGSPIRIGFRNSTAGTGTYNQRLITAALSTVISSGSTAGFTSAVQGTIYVYAIDNSGTVELAWSGTLYDEGSVVTTTAEGGAGAADSSNVIYSTTARTGVPLRLIGRIRATQATAGTWATAPSEIANIPFKRILTPTIQRFTSGSGTYTTPSGVTWLKVTMVGGGGGGSGSHGSGGNGGAGGAGGSTTFGSSLLTAAAGSGGAGGAGGAGGSATVASPAISVVAISGGTGTTGTSAYVLGGSGNGYSIGGVGANSPFGGAGVAAQGSAGTSAIANSGSGAGGGSVVAGNGIQTAGSGGGAGGYIIAIIPNPSATYAYSIGTSGSAGTAGTGGLAGGTGGSGVIIVEEFYQ